jgi:hypothetical protein
MLTEGAADKKGGDLSNATVFFAELNKTHFETSAELFVEAP